MFASPSVAEIIEVAKSYGIHLEEDAGERFRTLIARQLDEFDEFVQSRVEEDRPPLHYPDRARGYRPSAEEDRYNAWLWRCHIGGGDEGLLAGKRVSFKDHVAVAGIPLTFNAFVMEGFVPDFDATVVTRVLVEGGAVVGKNTMNGFTGGKSIGGFLGDYWNPVNPHGPGHLAGGTSSGCAVAVAADEADIAFGGDQAGSVRVPAAYCGVVGLKPTFGLVSHMGVAWGADQSLDHIGPMGRSVEAVAAALEAVAGHDGFDPRQSRLVPEHYPVLDGLPGGVGGLRVGVLEEGFDDPIDSSVRDGVLEAIDVLSRAGAEVIKVSVPEHRSVNSAITALNVEGARAIRTTSLFGAFAKTYYPSSLIGAVDRMWREHSDLLPPRTKLNLIAAEFSRRNFHGAVYAKAHNVRPSYIRAYDAALASCDVLPMPTCLDVAPETPATLGHLDAELAELNRATRPGAGMTRNTRVFDYTGHPALALPCGKIGGLPFSLQLVGRFFDDALVLRVAYAYQQSVDFEQLVAIEAPDA